MEYNQSRNTNLVRSLTIGLALGCTLFLGSEARGSGYEECNQILSQDIFNKVTKSDSSSSIAAAETAEAFFSQKDVEAFESYSRAFDEAKKMGQK